MEMEKDAQRAIIIGDLHGEYSALQSIIKALHNKGEINPETMVLRDGTSMVFLGDYMDRGDENLKTLDCVRSIKKANPESCFCLMGNHDLLLLKGRSEAEYGEENFKGLSRTTAINIYGMSTLHGANGGQKVVSEFESMEDFIDAFSLASEKGEFVRSLSSHVYLNVGNEKYLCMHAGPSSIWNTKNNLKRVERYLRKMSPDAEHGLCDKYSELTGADSIFWTRQPASFNEDDVKRFCDSLECTHIVHGHTKQKGEIKVTGEKMFNIDVGMSKGCGGFPPKALWVEKGQKPQEFNA